MSSERTTLDVIQIAEPCHQDWSRMSGDERRRFCGHCQKHVYDLTNLRRSEAEELLCRAAGNLCARFARDGAGTVVTLDYDSPKRKSRLPIFAAWIGALASAGMNLGIVRKPAPVSYMTGLVSYVTKVDPANPKLTKFSEIARRLPEIKMNETALSDAFDFMSDIGDFELDVNWNELARHGITRNQAITIALKDEKFGTALQKILDQAGTGTKLDYTINGGIIKISTANALK